MDTPPANPHRNSPHLPWYRFTLLLTGNATEAARILQEVMTTAQEQAAFLRNEDGWRRWLVRRIRNQCQAERLTPSAEVGVLAPIASVAEPARSAYALFHSLEIDTDALADLLELRPGAFAHAVMKARETLAPATEFPGGPKVPLHRPWLTDNRGVAQAVEKAQQNPAQAPLLKAQSEFDKVLHNEVSRSVPSRELYLPDFKGQATPGVSTLLRHPTVLAIAIAFAVVLGVTILFTVRKMDEFPGQEWGARLLEASIGETGAEFEPIAPKPVGRLADWFMLKGFEHFQVPPELENAIAVGCRVARFQGEPVAQVALQTRDSILFVFPEGRARQTQQGDDWRAFEHSNWAVAVRGTERNGYIVAFPGPVAEMDDFLQQLRNLPAQALDDDLDEEPAEAQPTPVTTQESSQEGL